MCVELVRRLRTCGDVREIGLQREQAAGAGKQVNTAISARQNVMAAHGDIMGNCEEVPSNGRARR